MRDELTRRGLLAGDEIIEPNQDLTGVLRELHVRGVTAVLCPSDWVALDAIAAARRLNLAVPGQLSMCSGPDRRPLPRCSGASLVETRACPTLLQ